MRRRAPVPQGTNCLSKLFIFADKVRKPMGLRIFWGGSTSGATRQSCAGRSLRPLKLRLAQFFELQFVAKNIAEKQ